jgi:pyridoxal phosphate enzyme (YggS family)
MSSIRDNVLRVRERIDRALVRAGRSGEPVTIVGITKTFGPDVVDALVDAGIEDIGENRVQEFLAQYLEVKRKCSWHLVGHLQRNKATKVIGKFSCVQSIDSLRLAETLDRLGGEQGVRTRALLQVNTSVEESKYGVPADAAGELAGAIAALPHIDLDGLMTIGPVTMDPVQTRDCFKQLYRLREEINRDLDPPLAELSMGMSGDFEMAIEEGATVVRLGRILTGERSR